MPSLRQLDYLVAIAETLHFRRAAERVNTTQSTLSTQIKALEDRLGTVLIERTRAHVMLTPLGHEVVDVARRMLRDAQEIRDIVRRKRQAPVGALRVGVMSALAPILMPRFAASLQDVASHASVTFSEAAAQALPGELEDGRLDIIVLPLPFDDNAIETVELFHSPMVAIASPQHALSGKAAVKLSQLATSDVYLLAAQHRLHDGFASLCSKARVPIYNGFCGGGLDTLCEMVAGGDGVTFVPRIYADERLAWDSRLAMLAITDQLPSCRIGLAWRVTTAHARDVTMVRTALLQAYGAGKRDPV